MKCEYCDNSVPSGATRCPSCGAMVSVENQQTLQDGRVQVEQPAAHIPIASSYTSAHVGMKPLEPLESKNKWVYILLGIFLGAFGIHNFYAGYIGRGVVKLLITILSFGFLSWISWLWTIVEICTVRMDSRGVTFTS